MMMKRAAWSVGLAAFVAAPAAAQWLGEPIWNSPRGGTGITIYGDYGRPNTEYGKGNAFGARAALGVGTITLTAGVASWKPESFNARVTSYGGTAAFRMIGGTLIPVAVNLQAGAAYSEEVTSGAQTLPATTNVSGAVGISVSLPTPGVSVEPYISPGLRYHHPSVTSGKNETNVGFVVGGNFSFGVVGIHLAYDSEKFDDGITRDVFGVGANVGLRMPLGM
jgi:hypothetical protein